MIALELSCAERDGAGHVTRVGGALADGTRWTKSLGEIMREIEEGAHYYVRFGAQAAALYVERDGNARHLACVVDASWTPAKLPRCPKSEERER